MCAIRLLKEQQEYIQPTEEEDNSRGRPYAALHDSSNCPIVNTGSAQLFKNLNVGFLETGDFFGMSYTLF